MAQQDLMALFVEFFKAHPALVITNMLFLFLVPVSEVVFPHFYGKIIDAMTHNTPLFTPFLHVIILLVVAQVLYTLSEHHDAKLLPYLHSFMSEKIVQRVLENHQEQHTELELGELNAKLTKLPATLISWFERVKNYVIPYLLVFVFAIVYFILYDVYLGVGLLVTLGTFALFFIKSPRSCLGLSAQRDKCFNKIHETIDDVLRNLFSVFGSNQEAAEIDRLQQALAHDNNLYEKTIKCVSNLKIWVTPITVCYLIFFAVRCYHLIERRTLSSSHFVPIFIVLLYILSAMNTLTDQLRDITLEWGMIIGSSDILERQEKKAVLDAHMMPVIPASGIGFHHVFFTYPGSNRPIIKDFTLHIRPGERVCIVGDIGSGKSTVIKLLMKYHIHDAGTIYLDGKNYMDLPVEEVRSRIGYVPQQPTLFNRSVMDNIMYGNTTHTRLDVEQLLETLEINKGFESLDQGYDTIIGKNGSKLSGGQRQLVWCLRVFLRNPQVILLDEPTASVDEKTKKIIHQLLDHMTKDKTVIMITHDPFLVNISTRVITMRGGEIINDPPPPQRHTPSSSATGSSQTHRSTLPW